MSSIRINLNDNWVETERHCLRDALATWDYSDGKVAVAINGEFVPRSRYDSVQLKDGDAVEVVAPVGGG